MAEAWVEHSRSEPLRAGEKYRLVSVVKAPYNAVTREALRFQFRAFAFANDYQIHSFEFLPPMYSAHSSGDSNQLAPWTVYMYFSPVPRPEVLQAGLDPRGLLALAGIIIASTLAFILIRTHIEHLTRTVGQEVRETVRDVTAPVFNPAFLVLAFGAFALFMLKGKG